MTQADRVLSTPPTNRPVDTTRRRFLAVAAFASVAGAGSLALAATAPNSVPAAVTVTVPRHSRPDPAFALADKRAADIAHCEAIDAQDAADERGLGVDGVADRCEAAGHAVNAIDWRLATTPPMSLAGVAAVLRFANEMKMPAGIGPAPIQSERMAGITSYGRRRRRSRRSFARWGYESHVRQRHHVPRTGRPFLQEEDHSGRQQIA
jgi:hypothetical protein